MKVYLSARYPRQAELRAYREQLEADGITVISRWLDQPPHAVHTTQHALGDVEDIYAVDVFVAFAEQPDIHSLAPYAARGGRHVEFGVAYECGCTCLVVGVAEGENVFHLLPGVGRVATWAEARDVLLALAEEELDARWRAIIAGLVTP